MKRILNVIMLLFLSISAINTFAQKLSELKPLKVGDKMPDIPLVNIFRHQNTKGGTLMSEFGGKPMIIDRWNTTCKPCVEALPLMDSLQKENAGKLNILLVDSWLDKIEQVDRVKSFLTTNPYLKNVTLPTTIMDSIMRKLFPGEPYQVWIDEQGIIRSISEGGQVNRENVKTFLAGKPLKLTQVKMQNDPYRNPLNFPLMVIDQNFNKGKGLKFYSYIAGYDSTANRVVVVNSMPYRAGKNTKIQFTNADLFQLYQIADPNVVIVDYVTRLKKPYQFIVNNPDRFGRLYPFESMYVPDSRDFSKLYNYEMISVDTSISKAYRVMKNDLDNFFNLESSFENRMLPCYIIKRIDPRKDVLKSKGEPSSNFTENGYRKMINGYWPDVQRYLNLTPNFFIKNNIYQKGEAPAYILPYQVFDETGYDSKFKVDISIPQRSAEWENLQAINEKLKKYNLVVTKEDRKLDVVVLKDRAL